MPQFYIAAPFSYKPIFDIPDSIAIFCDVHVYGSNTNLESWFIIPC